MEKLTRELLYRLGVTSRYKGYWYISYSIKILLVNEDYLLQMSASLYKEIAEHFQVSIHNVEYDIRTTIIVAWETNKVLLEEVSKARLYKPPTNKDFLEDLLSYIKKGE